MRKIYLSAFFIALFFTCHSQVQTLNRIGQTPGGASFNVNWDSTAQKLIVGCGTSLLVWDMSDPDQPVEIARRPLRSIINETDICDTVLFVAATHDGVYALDYRTSDLAVLHHYDMAGMGDSAAYDMWRTNDTLYVADRFKVRMFKYDPQSGFTKIGIFGPPRSFCVARRGDLIVVGGQGQLYFNPLPEVWARTDIYDKNDLQNPLASWMTDKSTVMMDIQFADRDDSLIYVCGGTEDLFNKSSFLALRFDGDSLFPVDTFTLSGGIIGFAQLNIMNMDSRNDTLFLATTSAFEWSWPPLSYIPVLDATPLPSDTMVKIGQIYGGLWHFDVSLMDGTPDMAIASEWCGVLVSDVSQLLPDDTVGLFETGGWCVNNKVKDGVLWACQEGYGLVAYNPDSLLYSNGFDCQSQEMHIYDLGNHYFSSDLEFLNDTLLMINSSEVYNISPWLAGGEPVLQYDMGKNGIIRMMNVTTNSGQRMVATWEDVYARTWMTLFNPLQSPYSDMALDSIRSDPYALAVVNDTVYHGLSIGNTRYLCAKKIVDDHFEILDTIKLRMGFSIPGLDHEAHGISVENGIIAVGYGQQFSCYRWNNNELEEVFMDYDPYQRACGVQLRNQYLYVADRFYGLKIYDISSTTNVELAAECRGSGGWINNFGSTGVTVDDEGTIYLTDFNAGVFIIQAFDTTGVGIRQAGRIPNELHITVFPNPSRGNINLSIDTPYDMDMKISIHDLNGRKLIDFGEMHFLQGSNVENLKVRHLAQGYYILEARGDEFLKTLLFGLFR